MTAISMVLCFFILIGPSLLPVRADIPPPQAQPQTEPQPQSIPESQAKDLCSYFKDIEAKTDADCAQATWGQLQSQDPATYAKKLELAAQRKAQVSKAYELLNNNAPPDAPEREKVSGQECKESVSPSVEMITPPINERTFPAWISVEDKGLKTVYSRWLESQNQKLQREREKSLPPERGAEITKTLQENSAKIAALRNITEPEQLNRFFENSRNGGDSNIASPYSSGSPGKYFWTSEDFKRANEAERNQYYIRTGKNKEPPTPSKLETELSRKFEGQGGQPLPLLPWAAGGALLGGFAGYLASRKRPEQTTTLIASLGLAGALSGPIGARYAMVQNGSRDVIITDIQRLRPNVSEGACPPGMIAAPMLLEPMNGAPGQPSRADPKQMADYNKCKQAGHPEEDCSKRFLMTAGQGHGPIGQPGLSGRSPSTQVNCVPRSKNREISEKSSFKTEKSGDESQTGKNKDISDGAEKLPGNGDGWIKLKGDQGWLDQKGQNWKKDQLHKDHWDIMDRRGKKVMEVDFKGRVLWPNGPKNKNKTP